MPKIISLIVVSFVFVSSVFAQNMGRKVVHENGDGQSMGYRLLEPDTTVEGEKYPLIVFMHGSGERGTDNTIQMQQHIQGIRNATQTDEFASYLIAPQLPPGNTFWSPNQPYDLTLDIIDALQSDFPIDTNRIYLTGLSLGGFGTMNYVATHPDRFAAAVPMSGASSGFLADQFKDVPTWLFHGDQDGVVNVDSSRVVFDAMNNEGGAPLFTEIRAGQHNIWGPIYSDWQSDEHGLYSWMFDQALPTKNTEVLVPFESNWLYLDDGSDQGIAWRAIDYADSEWKSGQAQFGYNDRDENTILNCGEDPACRIDSIPTTYFRTTFDIDALSAITSFEGQVLRDDAVAIYLNGQEIYRDTGITENAPFDEYALASLENSQAGFAIDSDLLMLGENLLSVELHQRDRTRDVSFDMRLAVRTIPEPAASFMLTLGLVFPLLTRPRRQVV